jgi:hypothetical protein
MKRIKQKNLTYYAAKSNTSMIRYDIFEADNLPKTIKNNKEIIKLDQDYIDYVVNRSRSVFKRDQ